MNTRERIKKELNIQKEIEGISKNDEDLILMFLDCCKSEQQFFSFINTKHYKYGVYSYQTHRFYYLKPELLNFVNKLDNTQQ